MQDFRLFFGPSRQFSKVYKDTLIFSTNNPACLGHEPILEIVIESMVLSQTKDLKKKQRILIPDSCTLIGVIDEAGYLQAGEVFV